MSFSPIQTFVTVCQFLGGIKVGGLVTLARYVGLGIQGYVRLVASNILPNYQGMYESTIRLNLVCCNAAVSACDKGPQLSRSKSGTKRFW